MTLVLRNSSEVKKNKGRYSKEVTISMKQMSEILFSHEREKLTGDVHNKILKGMGFELLAFPNYEEDSLTTSTNARQ